MSNKLYHRSVGRVLGAMRAGAVLNLPVEAGTGIWCLDDGTPVVAATAKQVIAHSKIVGGDDALFSGALPQTFRWRVP